MGRRECLDLSKAEAPFSSPSPLLVSGDLGDCSARELLGMMFSFIRLE